MLYSCMPVYSLLVSPVCTLKWGVPNTFSLFQLPPQIQGQMYAPKYVFIACCNLALLLHVVILHFKEVSHC